jgi:hypothetical protein
MESNSITDFLFQVLMAQSSLLFKYTCTINLRKINVFAYDEVEEAISKNFNYLEFLDWHWPTYPTKFYGEKDTFIVLYKNFITITSKNEETLGSMNNKLNSMF